MSHPENDSQVTTDIERRRREAAVKVGRQQVFLMEQERKLVSMDRKIQELLGRNNGLGSLLEEIEKENQEEKQEDAVVEVARRQKVVKLWRLQAKMMERERKLEKTKGHSLRMGSNVRKAQDALERMNQLLEHANFENVHGMVEAIDLVNPLSFMLDDLEKQIQEEEEEAQALR